MVKSRKRKKLLHSWKLLRKERRLVKRGATLWWGSLSFPPRTMGGNKAAFLPHHQAQKSLRRLVVNFLDRSNMKQGHDVEQKPWQNNQSPPLISLIEFDNKRRPLYIQYKENRKRELLNQKGSSASFLAFWIGTQWL